MSSQNNRPRTVTWLTVFVLITTGWQWFRFARILHAWHLIVELPLSVSPIYLALSSLIWAGLTSALTWGLVFGLRWLPSALRGISLAFVLILWIDKIFLQVSEPNNNNQVFALLITLAALATVNWIVSRPDAKAYFGEQNE